MSETKIERLKQWIDKQIKEIEEDERYQDESALVDVNAPLALIQCELEAGMAILKQVRKILNSSD